MAPHIWVRNRDSVRKKRRLHPLCPVFFMFAQIRPLPKLHLATLCYSRTVDRLDTLGILVHGPRGVSARSVERESNHHFFSNPFHNTSSTLSQSLLCLRSRSTHSIPTCTPCVSSSSAQISLG